MSERLPLTYELRTVADFVALPPDKIGACLTDFAAWLSMVHGAKAVGDHLGIDLRPASPLDVFGWIDDGKHVASVSLRVGDQEIASDSWEFAPPEPEAK